jgi:DNA-binding winged helix-turn-helix (wHTH) protein
MPGYPPGVVEDRVEGAMTVQFRLFGAVEADETGQRVDVGHARQQCVLAVLLAEANRVVTVEQLLDRVWADRLPQRARETLYSYLSRLRQVLAGCDGVGVVRRSGGYVLTVDPQAVDLHLFRFLVGRARSVADDIAAGLYEQALALCRGPVFGTLDTPWLSGVRAAVERERVARGAGRQRRRAAPGAACCGAPRSRRPGHRQPIG